jgi:hypothetical protein
MTQPDISLASKSGHFNLLRTPGLKAVFVGLNPSQTSVECTHYYQGRHGLRFWTLLSKYGLVADLPRGAEDDAAFEQGFGFADLVRRPTKKGTSLTKVEKSSGVNDLVARLSAIPDHPLIVFRYMEPWRLARERLEQLGYRVLRIPGPYDKRECVDPIMRNLQAALLDSSVPNSTPSAPEN